MGRINVGRVMLGGMLAGLVVNVSETILNVVVVASSMEAPLHERNLPPLGSSMGMGKAANAPVKFGESRVMDVGTSADAAVRQTENQGTK